MLRLEDVALELLEYKLEEIRARRTVRGGLSSVWELCHHLQGQSALLAPDEQERLVAAQRTLRHLGETSSARQPDVAAFADLVLDEVSTPEPRHATSTGESMVNTAERPAVSEEQQTLQKLAARVWRHDLDRFVRRIAGGLRAERERSTARLLYGLHRNLHRYLESDAARGDSKLERFRVLEPVPAHDDPLLSVNDVDSLAELVRETIDCVLDLGDREGPYRVLEVLPGSELTVLRELAKAIAADPYAGRVGLLQQRGPTAQQLRVAIQELGKERLRDSERLSQRRHLEERLQRVMAFERHQRQVFHQDVAQFTALAEAFFDRIARYLPKSVGGQADPPRLSGSVLFALNPALRTDALDPNVTSASVRLKGPTRVRVGGLEISVSGAGPREKLYVGGEEHDLDRELAVGFERKWLRAFKEGPYLHLKIEDEARSTTVRVAEAAAVLAVLASPQRTELLASLRILANSSVGETQDIVPAALAGISAVIAKAPDRTAALRGFLLGAARAAGVQLSASVVNSVCTSMQRVMSVDSADLGTLLESVDLGESAVFTLTGEPLAIEVASFSLTVRQYRAQGFGTKESLVVMLPGQPLGTFEEYLIEPLGDGLLVCVKGEQELVVGYKRTVTP